MSRFISSRFDSLEEYVPGEQPRDKKYIKLNTNESPFQPSPAVLRAASDQAQLFNLYSDPTLRDLRSKIASLYGVEMQNVIATNGSDEALSFAFMAYCDKDTGAAYPEISYGFYKVFGQLYGLDCLELPLRDDFTVNISDYFGLGRTVFIANPNAPTGIALTPDEIEQIVINNPDNVVVIDEAYVDFGAQSCVPLTKKYKNLLVVQTFSKSRSLAGARIGFAIGDASLISDLEKLRYSTNPYNVNRMSAACGCAALDENAQKLGAFELCPSDCFVIGHEGHGLTEKTLESCTGSVFIPMKKGAESLNASAAAAVLLWEQARLFGC